jgi:DNA-binding MarR family transcriptional regulator
VRRLIGPRAAYPFPMADTGEPRWLDESQQRAWRALIMGMTLLTDRLDADLRRGFDVSLAEYEILVRLSERPERQLRMAQLADAMAHSRSRVTHTVARMEKAGLVIRTTTADDGRGIFCAMTQQGFELLEQMAPTHVGGVRDNLVDLASPTDLEALGRVMNAVSDRLIVTHPEMEIR